MMQFIYLFMVSVLTNNISINMDAVWHPSLKNYCHLHSMFQIYYDIKGMRIGVLPNMK